MTRPVKCHLCQGRVRSADVTLDADGDAWCAHDRRCYRVALTRLGLMPHTAEFLSRRLYAADELAA